MAKFSGKIREMYRQAIDVAIFAREHQGKHTSSGLRREREIRDAVAQRVSKQTGIPVTVNKNGDFVADTRPKPRR